MEGFVAPTSNPCVVDLHEEVFDFSCYLDDTEKVVKHHFKYDPTKPIEHSLQVSQESSSGKQGNLGLGQTSQQVQHW